MVEREVVTGPRRPQRRARRPATSDIDEQTRLGDVYLRGLMRTQLRLGLAVGLSTLGLLAALPVVFALAPGTATPTIAGIPVPWWLLGVAAYPLLAGAAWMYVRQSERVEREFTDLVDRR